MWVAVFLVMILFNLVTIVSEELPASIFTSLLEMETSGSFQVLL
jgi:hypothetical protein